MLPRCFVALALLLALPVPGSALTVFAASSLTDVLTALADDMERRGDVRPRISFAATSTLARQIMAGAPADVFLSASPLWTDHLLERGHLHNPRPARISNRLVLVGHGPRGITPQLLLHRLERGQRLALGDPVHVPAGMYARRALQHYGLWESLKDRIAPSDNVRAALALTARGESPYAVVYATDAAIVPDMPVHFVFPPASHGPIVYPFALVVGGDVQRGEEFLDGLESAQSKRHFESAGFIWLERDE